jgi:hypothetical protein
VPGGLTAVDVQDLAGDERGPLEIEDPVGDVADVAYPAPGVGLIPSRPYAGAPSRSRLGRASAVRGLMNTAA